MGMIMLVLGFSRSQRRHLDNWTGELGRDHSAGKANYSQLSHVIWATGAGWSG